MCHKIIHKYRAKRKEMYKYSKHIYCVRVRKNKKANRRKKFKNSSNYLPHTYLIYATELIIDLRV